MLPTHRANPAHGRHRFPAPARGLPGRRAVASGEGWGRGAGPGRGAPSPVRAGPACAAGEHPIPTPAGAPRSPEEFLGDYERRSRHLERHPRFRLCYCQRKGRSRGVPAALPPADTRKREVGNGARSPAAPRWARGRPLCSWSRLPVRCPPTRPPSRLLPASPYTPASAEPLRSSHPETQAPAWRRHSPLPNSAGALPPTTTPLPAPSSSFPSG